MKSIDMKDLNDFIAQKKNEVEQKMFCTRPHGKKYRTRPRDPDEIKYLIVYAKKDGKKLKQPGK